MPRGDGRKAKEARPQIKRLSLGQYIPKRLASRINWWENDFHEGKSYTERDKHDGKGNSFRRPGSQQ